MRITVVGDGTRVRHSSLVLAAVELWSGQPESAHERLPALRATLVGDGSGFVGSLMLGVWSYDVEALPTLGRLEEASAILDELVGRARSAENPNAVAVAHRCRGLMLAARGETADAIEVMDAALAEHARRPFRSRSAVRGWRRERSSGGSSAKLRPSDRLSRR
jgi:Tetratrico peptide repeat